MHDMIVIIDLAKIGTWEQWEADGPDGGLKFSVVPLTEDSATELATAQPTLLADDNHIELIDRVRLIRGNVLVSASNEFSIENLDLNAARLIKMNVDRDL